MPYLRLFAGRQPEKEKSRPRLGGRAGLELGFQAALAGRRGVNRRQTRGFGAVGHGGWGRAAHPVLAFE